MEGQSNAYHRFGYCRRDRIRRLVGLYGCAVEGWEGGCACGVGSDLTACDYVALASRRNTGRILTERYRGFRATCFCGEVLQLLWEDPLDLTSVFAWFAQESISIAEQAAEPEQREKLAELALLWATAAQQNQGAQNSSVILTEPLAGTGGW